MLILTRGVPASGKSTWAKAQVAMAQGKLKRICKDDLRLMFDGSHWLGREHEEHLNDLVHVMIDVLLDQKFDVVLDETFMNVNRFTEMVDAYRRWQWCDYGQDILIVDFTIPLDVVLDRNAARGYTVPSEVVTEYYQMKKEQDDVFARTGCGEILAAACWARLSYPYGDEAKLTYNDLFSLESKRNSIGGCTRNVAENHVSDCECRAGVRPQYG